MYFSGFINQINLPLNFPNIIQAQRPVDPREVTARMDSAIVRAVLKMDVPRRLVKQAIKKRLSENGE